MDRKMPPSDQLSSSSMEKKGGWTTFPFIIAISTGVSLTFGGLFSNLIVYLIQEFNVGSISAAKTYNVANGCTAILPVVGAIIADSYLSCYTIIWIASLISSLGLSIIVLTAAIPNLRPPHCENVTNSCTSPSLVQLSVLYIGLALVSLGIAGTRFIIGPMGAYQFEKTKHQAIFFNWYVFTFYITNVISTTAIVYVQDNVSWAWGYAICVAANVLGLVVFLAGSGFYRKLKPTGSPFASLIRVIVAAIRKRDSSCSDNTEDYFQDPESKPAILPTKSFGFLNNAALISEGDTKEDRSIKNPWRLCTLKEVENFKTLIKLLPLWSSAIIVSVPVVIQISMIILQALKMDRHLGTHFQVPAGSMPVFTSISTCIIIFLSDRILFPMWNKFRKSPITPLQRVGIGHALDILSMLVSALVEAKRLKLAKNEQFMSAFWLVPSLAMVGFGEALHFVGHVEFYYQEFPASLKSTSTAIVALSIGLAFYLGNALIGIVRSTTGWLPDDINKGRLDNVYWLVASLGGINFCYFILCASKYRYQNVVEEKANDSVDKD